MKGIKRHIGTLLLVLFASYYAGITVFRHVHRLNGSTIVHSHPYTDGGNHTHSAADLQFIQQLSAFLSLAAAAVAFFLGCPYRLTSLFLPRPIFRPAEMPREAKSLRGPPATAFFA